MSSLAFFFALLGLASLGAAEHFALRNNADQRYCILMDVDFEGQIQYATTDNKTVNYKFNVTTAGLPEGQCLTTVNQTSVSIIKIFFFPNNITPPERDIQKQWEITFTFSDHGEDKNMGYELSDYSLKAVFYADLFKNAVDSEFIYKKDPKAENTVHWTKGDKIKGFTCSSSGVSFKNESNLTLNNFKVLPFASLDTDKYPEGMDVEKCPMDLRTSDIVPIVVGACLAGLVIIVLVAYLIGRARAKRQGYASV